MSRFEALRLVMVRELRERSRSKAFIGSSLFTLLLLAAVILLPALLGSRDVTFEVGSLGSGNDEILALAETLAVQSEPERTVEFRLTRYGTRDAAEAALDESEVEVVLVDGATVLRKGSSGFDGSDAEAVLQRAAATLTLEEALSGSEVTAGDVASIIFSTPLTVVSLAGSDTAEDQARSVIAYGGLVLMYMAVLSFGAWTLTGIAEEKTNRVVEILLATLRPWQLLAGKILGIGLLGLGQFLVTIGVALTLISVAGSLDLPAVPLDSAVTLVLWFILGYGLFSVAFGTAGALVSRMEDAQTGALPISVVAVLGFFASFTVLDDPTGLMSRILSYVPFTAPFVVPIRVAFQEIPPWEHALAVAVTVTAIVGLIRFAGRVYAGGLLHTGAKLGYRQAYRSAEIH